MSPRNTVARVLERLVVVLSVIILLMSVTSIASILVIQREVRGTATTISPLIEDSTSLRVDVTEAQTHYRTYLLIGDAASLERYRASRRAFQEGEEDLRASAARSVVDPQQVRDFLDAGEAWFEAADAEIAAGDERDGQGVARTSKNFDRVTQEHEALVVEIADARQERRDRYGLAMNGGIALMGLATLLALIVTVHQGRRALGRLARPLQALHRVVMRQAGGATQARADTTHGADEVVALASAFNSLAETNASMQDERERRLDLYRTTGSVAGVLRTREGGWDGACAKVGVGLGADATSIYRLTGEDTVSRMGAWHSSGAAFPPVLDDVVIPGLARMLADTPILQAATAAEIAETFPPALTCLGEQQALQGWVLHPMCFGDEAVGVLSVASLREHSWDEAQIQAMARVAEYGAHTLVEQRYVTSLEELDEQKSAFMATTSHELRTPLTSIAGYLELLEDGDYGSLTDPQSRALGIVSRNVERLRSLIDDLLLLNRLDSGQTRVDRREHDVGRSVARVGEQFAPVAAAAGVDLTLEEAPDPVLVLADPTQIERAVGNLVSNAVKFTPSGGTVRLSVLPGEDEVSIVCADTGMGVPAADQTHLFTRFFRATNAQHDQVQGTGLGLVIVETIAAAHGGRVDLTSVEDEGTTVTIVLPTVTGTDREVSALRPAPC